MGQPLRSLDDLIRRLGPDMVGLARHAGMRSAADSIYAAERPGWRIAEDLLHRYPESLDRIDQFVADNGMRLGDQLGAGAESLVFELRPRSSGNANVLKVRVGDAEPSDFDFPQDVPGVVPYAAREQIVPGVAAALQPKADVVYRPKFGLEKPFQNAAERLKESLLARGWDWGDGHKWNLGVMPDNTWGAIDGFLYQAHPAWTRPNLSNEESIRMLRLTPEEMMAITGGEAM